MTDCREKFLCQGCSVFHRLTLILICVQYIFFVRLHMRMSQSCLIYGLIVCVCVVYFCLGYKLINCVWIFFVFVRSAWVFQVLYSYRCLTMAKDEKSRSCTNSTGSVARGITGCNISTIFGLIAVKFCKGIHGPRMKPTDWWSHDFSFSITSRSKFEFFT